MPATFSQQAGNKISSRNYLKKGNAKQSRRQSGPQPAKSLIAREPLWRPDQQHMDLLNKAGQLTTAGYGAPAEAVSYGRGRKEEKLPQDIPSIVFDARIIVLGMPIVPAVSELICFEFMHLQNKNAELPMYFYINSTGVQRADGEVVAQETEGFAIYDMMQYVKNKVYTLGYGLTAGLSTMLLASGHPGRRYMSPHATAILHQPKVPGTGQRQAVEVHTRWQEALAMKNMFLDIMSKHTKQPASKIDQDITCPIQMGAFEAVEYGVIDTIIQPEVKIGNSNYFKEVQKRQKRAEEEKMRKEYAEKRGQMAGGRGGRGEEGPSADT